MTTYTLQSSCELKPENYAKNVSNEQLADNRIIGPSGTCLTYLLKPYNCCTYQNPSYGNRPRTREVYHNRLVP